MHSTIHQCLLYSLFLTARNTVFKEYVLSVFVIFRKKNLCRREPGPHGGVFIPDSDFTKIYSEICGWPKGHRHHPNCQWVCFCATTLQALLHSSVRRCLLWCCLQLVLISSSTSFSLVTSFLFIFCLGMPSQPLFLLCCSFTAEMYLLFSMSCTIFIGHHTC